MVIMMIEVVKITMAIIMIEVIMMIEVITMTMVIMIILGDHDNYRCNGIKDNYNDDTDDEDDMCWQ